MIKKVICQGQEVDAIVNGEGETLAVLTADVENEAAYVIPTGTLDVNQNGDYNVREKESIHVHVEGGADPVAPTLTVSEGGLVTASGAGVVQTTHKLSSADDSDFTEENIAEGVTIFGKTGTHPTPSGSITLTENGTYDVTSKASAVVAVPAPAPATPSISVSAAGLVTVSGEGIVTTTHQLSEADDADFTSANIAKNATIFGKTGSYEGGGSPSPTWTYFITNNSSEKTLKQVFEALDFDCGTKNGWIQVVLNQPNAPTTGFSTGKTYGAFVVGLVNGEVAGGITFYKAGLNTLDTTSWMFGNNIGAGSIINTSVCKKSSKNGKLIFDGTGSTDCLGIGGSARYCFQECKMA